MARDYRRMWRQRAWTKAIQTERRAGVWLSLGLTFLAGLVVWILADGPDPIALATAVLISWLLVLLLIWLWALRAVPAEVAFEAGRPIGQDPDPRLVGFYKEIIRAPNSPRQLVVEFVTTGERDRLIKVGFEPEVVRFVEPREKVVKPGDPPVSIRMPWRRGRLVITRFWATGFYVDEEGTSGRMIRAEVQGDDPAGG